MIDITRIDLEVIEAALNCYIEHLDGVIEMAHGGSDALNLANAEVLVVDRREATELRERVSEVLDASQ